MTVNNKFYLQIQSVPDAFEDVSKSRYQTRPPSRGCLTEDGLSAVKTKIHLVFQMKAKTKEEMWTR